MRVITGAILVLAGAFLCGTAALADALYRGLARACRPTR